LNGRFSITNSIGWGLRKRQNLALAMNLFAY
jgi:hypothetical protein